MPRSLRALVSSFARPSSTNSSQESLQPKAQVTVAAESAGGGRVLCGVGGLLGAVAALGFVFAWGAASAQVAAQFGGSQTALFTAGNSNVPAIAVDASGNVYLADGSQVLKETLSGGVYTQSVVATGFYTVSGVAVDAAGNVYISDSGNGNNGKGLVAKATLSGGTYTQSTVVSGLNDAGSVAVDASGNVYIAATGNMEILKETPSGSSYVQSTVTTTSLYPYAVAVDVSGNVYYSLGSSIVKETLSGTSYTQSTLASGLNSVLYIAVDPTGNVYAQAYQSLLKITSSGTQTTLQTGLNYPFGVATDASGNYYIANGGVVSAATKTPLSIGQVAVGSTSRVQTETFTFTSAGTIGAPVVLTQGAAGLDFADAGTGTCTTNGTAHSYAVGASCTVDVTLTPKAPGQRLGGVELVNSSGAVVASAYLQGVGAGPQSVIYPGTQSTPFGTSLSAPAGVATDGAGNVYLAMYGGSAFYKETLSGGSYTQTSIAGVTNPTGVAVDGLGNVYIANYGGGSVLKETLSNGTYTQTTIGSNVSDPVGVAVDGSGNVYIATYGGDLVYKETLSGGTYTQTSIGSGLSGPGGVAVDAVGNVYIADTFNNRVLKETLSTGTYTQSVVASNFSEPYGVAVDANGDVYVPDYGNARLVKETPSGTGYTQSVLATSLGGAFSLAFDPAGNVLVGTLSSSVYKIDVTDAQTLTFASTNVGSTSASQTVTLANIGNEPLTFPVPSMNTNPAISTGYVLGSTSTCPQLTTSSYNAGTLAAGASCTDVLSFAPTVGGTVTGQLVTTDTNLNASPGTTQLVKMTGTAVVTVPVLTGVSPAAGPAAGGTTVTITGTGFTGATAVNFGSKPATSFTVVSSTSITAITPASAAGVVDVSVTTSGGTTATVAADHFTYTTPQTITFPQPATPVVNGSAPVTLTATASSGLPVVYSVVSGPATVSGSTLTYTGAGTVVVEADQPGNATFAAAAPVQDSITVAAAASNYLAPATAVGVTSATQTATVTFTTAGTLGSITVVTQGATGLDFAYVAGGTNACAVGASYLAGQACTVQYSFTPGAPGRRLGAIALYNSANPAVQIAASFLNGTGTGALAEYTNGVRVTVSPLNSPRGVKADAAGNVYVGTADNGGSLLKFNAAGTSKVLLTSVGNAQGIAVDGAGNIYYGIQNSSTSGGVYELIGGTGTPVQISSVVPDASLAVDGAGNLYVPQVNTGVIFEFAAGTHAQSTFLAAGSQGRVAGITLDAAGNLFFGDYTHNNLDEVVAGTHAITTLVTGTDQPGPDGIAIDPAGNLYVTFYAGDNTVRRYAAGSYAETAIGTNGNISITIDGNGTIYSNGTGNLFRYNRLTVNPLVYPATAIAGASAAQSTVLENDGNAALLVGSLASSNANFTVGTATASAGSTASSVAAAGSLSVPVSFTPQAGGALSGTLTVSSNSQSLAGSLQPVALSGTGTPVTPVVVVGNTSVVAGGTATLSATVTYQGIVPSGAFTFTLGTSTVTANCNGAAGQETCTAALAATGLASGSYPVTGTLASDVSYNTASGVGALTVVPASFAAPSTPLAGTPAALTVTLVFNGPVTLNATPATAIQVLTQGAQNLDFTFAPGGTCAAAASYTAGQSCTVNVSFNPKAPGQRLGAVVLFDGSATPVQAAASLLSGTGTGPQAVIYPGTQSTVINNLPDTFGIAVDSSNILYVGDIGDGALVKETPQAGGGYLATTVDPNLGFFGNIAVDGAGNLFVADVTNNQVVEEQFNAATGVYTPIVVFNNANNGLYQPFGLTIDGAGAIYIGNGGQLLKETPSGSGYIQTLVDGTLGNIIGLTVDASGNLYVADGGNAALLKETYSAGTYTQSTIATGLGNANGVAVDAAGTVYAVADNTSNQVLRYAPIGSGGYTPLTPVGQFYRTNGIALAPNGNLLVTDDGAGGLVDLIDVNDAQALSFNATTVGTTNGSQTVEVDNIGSGPLAISALASSSASFTVVPATTTCSTGAGLASAANCNVSVAFSPQTAGALSGVLSLTDNNLNVAGSAQLVNLNGTGTPATPVVVLQPATVVYGTATAALSATVTYPGSTAPSGAFTFTVGSGSAVTATCAAATSTTETCTASYPTASLTVNNYTVTGSLAADTNYAIASTTGTLSVTQATPVLSVANVTGSFSNTSATLTATLAYSGTVAPTGAVVFSLGGSNVTAACAGTSSPLTCTASVPLAGASLGANAIGVTVAADTNYTTAAATGTLTLTAATATVTVTSATAVYGTENTTLTASVSYTGTTAPTGDFSFTAGFGPAVPATCTRSASPLTCTATYPTSALAANTYTVTGSLAADSRFAASTGTGTLTVTPALPTVSVANQTISYGTATATLTATYSFAGATPPSGAVTFTVDTGAVVAAACSASTSTRTCTASYPAATLTAGTHTTKASVAADANFSAATGTGTLTVTLTTPVVTVASQSIAYGTANATLSTNIAFSGSIPTGAVTFTIDTGAAVTAICSGTASPRTCTASYPTSSLAVGTHTAKASLAADANYSASSATGTLTVTSTTPVITVASVSASYGAASTALSANVAFTGAVPASAVMFAVDNGTPVVANCAGTASPLSCTATYSLAGLTAGTHTITVTLAADSNYTAASGTGTLTLVVTNATISFTVPNHSYGDPAFTVSATSNSTGAFTYSVISGPATVAGSTVTLNGIGSVVLQASQAADTNFVAGSKQASFTVSAAALTATAANATRVYGAANPAFTGTVTGAKYSDTFTENFTTAATASSPVGTYAIVPAVTGPDLADYTATSTDGTLTVTQAPTVTSFTASAASANPNQSVTFNAAVASTTTGTPTGTVTFLDNGAVLASVPLVNGGAAYSTATLTPATTHSISVTYSGDTNFLTSTTATGLPITVGALDFTFATVGATAYTAAPGKMATYNFALSPDFTTYSGTVSLSVTGLPLGATASFSPATVAGTAGPQAVVMSVQTPQPTAENRPDPTRRDWPALALFLLPALGSRRMRRKLGARMLLLMLLAAGLGGASALTGCGTGSNGFQIQAPSTYTLTVTATSGSLQHSQTVTLTVQ